MGNLFAELRRHQICRIGAVFALALYFGASAQAANAPIPDFTGDPNTSWYPDREDGDNYLAPTSGPGPVVSPPDFPYRPNGAGDDAAGDPTYRVADLSNPILQPWAIEQMRIANEKIHAGEIPFTARQRCYPPGPAWHVFRRVFPPMIFFIQMPEKVLIHWRGDNLTRHVYLNVPHSLSPKPTWHGESVGHYEGDTLVVDTIAFLDHPLSFADNYRTPHSDQLHMIERFEMTDADKIDISIYFEDPGAYTMSWRARQILSRSERGPIEETICADGNPDYFNIYSVPIPQADRADF